MLEALKAAAWREDTDLKVQWINAETASEDDFAAVDGLLVPGGFGTRGASGKTAAAAYALENNKPYLGICLGLQVAVIAAARRAGVEQANSTECDAETPDDVVYIMDGQQGKESTGGTLRLGNYPAPVSYTHLDVYKRQGADALRGPDAAAGAEGGTPRRRRAGTRNRPSHQARPPVDRQMARYRNGLIGPPNRAGIAFPDRPSARQSAPCTA